MMRAFWREYFCWCYCEATRKQWESGSQLTACLRVRIVNELHNCCWIARIN